MDTIVCGIVYLILVIPMAFLFGFISENDDKYDALHSLIWPYGLILLLIDLFNFINFYLTQNNLKQMNFKILGKAMGFMFLPTLGVLLTLLVGFFDPIMLWTWIKSDSGWAIFTRIFIFLLETGLVTILYFNYLKEEIRNNAIGGSYKKRGIQINYDKYIKSIFDGTYKDEYICYDTQNEDIKVIEIIRKKD